jgi:hypothetical protein
VQQARCEHAKVSEDEFDACRDAMQRSVVARESETRGGRVERDDYENKRGSKGTNKKTLVVHIRTRKRIRDERHTAFACPRKGNRITADATECIEDDVAATPLCYLCRDRLGRYAVPPFLVQQTTLVVS